MADVIYYCKKRYCGGHEHKRDYCETWIKDYSNGTKKIVYITQ